MPDELFAILKGNFGERKWGLMNEKERKFEKPSFRKWKGWEPKKMQ